MVLLDAGILQQENGFRFDTPDVQTGGTRGVFSGWRMSKHQMCDYHQCRTT